MSEQGKFSLYIGRRKVVPDKKCIFCGVMFSRTITTSMSIWNAKKTCSSEYSTASRKAKAIKKFTDKHGADALSDKPCEACGKIMSSGGISNHNFLHQRTCSMECCVKIRNKAGKRRVVSRRSSLADSWSGWDDQAKAIHKALTMPLIVPEDE